MRKKVTEQTISGLTLQQANGKACVCCGAAYSSSARVARVHVGQSETGHKIFACKTCPGADRPQTLRQPWCRADRRPALAVRRHDSGIGIAHAKIVRDDSNLPLSPFARALIYFNPNSAKAWELPAKQVKDLGQWLVHLADEVAHIHDDGKLARTTPGHITERATWSGNVQSLDEARSRRNTDPLRIIVEPKPATDFEATLTRHAQDALLRLEKRFGTRALYLGYQSFSKSNGGYMARVNSAVPEVVETMSRMMAMIGEKPKPEPAAKPFPAPESRGKRK